MRILVVSEFHALNTGYALCYKHICESLHKAGHEVFELACYGNEGIKEHVEIAEKCAWDVYLNIPNRNSPKWNEYVEAKKTNSATEHGAWNYNNIVLDCMPDTVLAIRDHWYDKHIVDSPLRNYYNIILSPTVDSRPLKSDWIDTYGQVDKLTSYNQWSENWLKEQMGGDNIVSHIAPGVHPAYKKLDIRYCRSKFGIPFNRKLILTVMRNQGRKRYPELFEALSRLSDVYLHCHCHYLDRYWDLPKLATQYGVQNRVYFTYKCKDCSDISVDFYKEDGKCNKCNGNKEICTVQDGVTPEELNLLYNNCNIYVQWANSEGFGVSPIEAAACGKRVITVDYSAQEDVGEKVLAHKIKPLTLQREVYTLCNRAIPDNNALVEYLSNDDNWTYSSEEIIESAKLNYNWESNGAKWAELVESLPPRNNWGNSPTLIHPPSLEAIGKLSNVDFVKACILSIAQDESLLGSILHAETLEHLNKGHFIPHGADQPKIVNKELVYNKFIYMLEERVKWEKEKNRKLSPKI
jgi:glycosyltransferase involved in cell wall biosynthesis